MKPTSALLTGLLPALTFGLALATAPAFADDLPVDDGVVEEAPVDPGSGDPETVADYDPVIAQSGVPIENVQPHGVFEPESHHYGQDNEVFKRDANGIRPSLFGTDSPLRRWLKQQAAK